MRTRFRLVSSLLRYRFSFSAPISHHHYYNSREHPPEATFASVSRLRSPHFGIIAAAAASSSSMALPPSGAAAAVDGSGSEEVKMMSMTRPGQHKSPITDMLWSKRLNLTLDGPPQTTLLTKTPADSMIVLDYKFAQDEQLRELYRNPWGSVRVGKLMEDLDACAGAVAFKHSADSEESRTRAALVVTASVDKMSMLGELRLDRNVTLVGAVTWVGRSSMEIQMKIILDHPPSNTNNTNTNTNTTTSGEEAGGAKDVLIAYFTFVARDARTGKAVAVNRLSPQTDAERRLFSDAAARDALRKRRRLLPSSATSPSPSSSTAAAAAAAPHPLGPTHLHDHFAKLLEEGRVLREMPALADRDSILISATRLENTIICQPQQRNVYGRIFGGFLMRRAFELAFATTYVFAGSRPIFLDVDHIEFRRPVEIGDLLRFKSCVLYTEEPEAKEGPPLVHIEVVAYITKPELKSSQISNTFYFTLTVDGKRGTNPRIRRVLPASEEEARTVVTRYEADHHHEEEEEEEA